jgi:muramidase (phage lysozyme)
MRNKKVNKLWKGIMVSVRDYEVADAIEKGGLRITHNDQTMILTPDELRMLKPSSKKFQSRYTGAYQLMDITWKPLTENPDQTKLFEKEEGHV